jgi:Sulfotransferase domain
MNMSVPTALTQDRTQDTRRQAKPNLFLVGAPKCGTTALYEYLRPHPNIFMSGIKEPHFFATDLAGYREVQTEEAYAGLFAESRPEHLVLGEASVYYLRSSVALERIQAYNPQAKIIAMFRNPVDMVYSLHSQLLYWSEEVVGDFETAWRLQERRRLGLDLPPESRSPLLVQYGEVGRFGTQAQRVLSLFPKAQVKLIVYDDFTASPRKMYDEVIEFLGIPHDQRTEFPRINENKRARMTWLRDFYRKPPQLLHGAVRGFKRAVGSKTLSTVRQKIVDLNTVKEHRAPLPPKFRAELVEFFRPEVALLSRILDRDLSQWER